MTTRRPTQADAVRLCADLQARAAGPLPAPVAAAERERRAAHDGELARLSEAENAEALHRMGAVAWLLLACAVAGIVGAWVTWLWAVG